MDLPPNKAKVLRNYTVEKKWELVCDQVGSFSGIFLKFMQNFSTFRKKSQIKERRAFTWISYEFIWILKEQKK